MDTFIIKFLLFILGSLVFSFLMNHIFLRFVKTLGIRNNGTTVIRWSDESKPALGGITFYIVFLLSGAIYPIFFGDSTLMFSLKSIGILSSVSLGFLMGLADDAYNTRPILKSLTQLTCGIILIFTGTQIEIFESDVFNKLLTLVWVVGIMNSLNMLDNMDGITSIVSLFVCITIVTLTLIENIASNMNLIIVTGMGTALIAFLYFNWHPAKMYMGDSGSQFLGIAFAAMGIIYFWNPVSIEGESAVNVSKHLILPLLAFLVPIIDTTSVTINRLSKGQSPFVGGKDHTTHSLSRLGLGDKNVAYLIGLISLISSSLVIIICTQISSWGYAHFIAFLVYALLIFSALFYVTKRKNN